MKPVLNDWPPLWVLSMPEGYSQIHDFAGVQEALNSTTSDQNAFIALGQTDIVGSVVFNADCYLQCKAAWMLAVV